MRRYSASVFGVSLIFLLMESVNAQENRQDLQVVPSVDLTRYAGKWFEIARFPNSFQKRCAANTTATYTPRPDGKITVVNACDEANGHTKLATGTARVADKNGPNTKLKVTFFWPFSGDYWIIDLDKDYRWVVVGEPKRNYLWILSRDKNMDAALYQQLVQRAKDKGFATGKLIKTPQH